MPAIGGPDKDLPNSPTRPGEPKSDSDSRSGSFPGNIRQTLDGRMAEPGSHVAAQQAMTQVRPSPARVVARESLPGKHAETGGATSAISAAAESRPVRKVGRPSPSRSPPVPATASESLQSEAQPTYTGELHAKPDARHQGAQPPASAGDQRGHRAPRISVSKSSHPAPRVAQRHGVRSPGSITRSQTSPLSQQNPPAVPVAPKGPVGRTELPPKPPAVLSPPNRVARAPSHNDRMVPGTNTGARHLPPTPLEMHAQKARDTLGSSSDRLEGEQREYPHGFPRTQGRSQEPTRPPAGPTEEPSVSPNESQPPPPYRVAVCQRMASSRTVISRESSQTVSRQSSKRDKKWWECFLCR